MTKYHSAFNLIGNSLSGFLFQLLIVICCLFILTSQLVADEQQVLQRDDFESYNVGNSIIITDPMERI